MGTVSAAAEQKGTIIYADFALRRIKALGVPGDPRNYAAWFTYATNCSPSHNSIVNETIGRKGSISAAEIEKIYGYAPPNLITDNIDNLATKAADEVEQAMAVIDAAAGTIAGYRDDLIDVAEQLDGAQDRQGLSAIVESLIRVTKGMEAKNEAFVASLKASKQEMSEVRKKVEALRIDSLTDPLTRLGNRECFERELDRCLAEAEPSNEELCLLLMDVDRLRTVNEAFGHMAGDEVIRAVSHALKQHAQPHDVAARVGGEEFAVILPNTHLRSALTVADHIRCRVMGMQFMKRSTGESMGRVTVSGGIARYRKGETPWALMQRADNCLTAAKRQGRNRVICDNDGLAVGAA